MLERKKFTLHSVGFFCTGLRRSKAGTDLLPLLHLRKGTYSWASFATVFFTTQEKLEHPQRLVSRWQKANLGWHMRLPSAQNREGNGTLCPTDFQPWLLSFPMFFSMVLWPGWCAGCLQGAASKHLWSRNKLPNLKMFVSRGRHTQSWRGSSLQDFWGARVPPSCVHVSHGSRQSPNFFFPSDCSPSLRGAVLPPPAKCGCFYGRASGDPLKSIAFMYGFAGK